MAAAIDVGLFVLTLCSRDAACAPGDGGGAFVELDVAPELDALLAPGSPLLAAAADACLAWLFPPGAPRRVPLIATTGTNGKTTTSRMVAAVLRAAGFTTGLACTDGVYLDDEPLELRTTRQSEARTKLSQRQHQGLLNHVSTILLQHLESAPFVFDGLTPGKTICNVPSSIHHVG